MSRSSGSVVDQDHRRADSFGEPGSDSAKAVLGTDDGELEDIKALRRERRKLRAGRERREVCMRKARRELAQLTRRQQEAEKELVGQESALEVISKRLGCTSAGLPEVEEWRSISYNYRILEEELQDQIQQEKAAHDERMATLQAELAKGGRPETSRAADAAEELQLRKAADELCGRLLVVRDYINGQLADVSSEELMELLRPSDVPLEQLGAPPEPSEDLERLEGLVLRELRERHEQSLRDLTKLSNSAIGRKDTLLRAVAGKVLKRGMEDPQLCTPAERSTLRELLKDVESICAYHLRAGGAAMSSS